MFRSLFVELDTNFITFYVWDSDVESWDRQKMEMKM